MAVCFYFLHVTPVYKAVLAPTGSSRLRCNNNSVKSKLKHVLRFGFIVLMFPN